jgi:hypothetical protein
MNMSVNNVPNAIAKKLADAVRLFDQLVLGDDALIARRRAADSALAEYDAFVAAGTNGVQAGALPEPESNNPISALAIRLLVGLGKVSQEDANQAFHAACHFVQEEARRANVELPWVVAPFLKRSAEPPASNVDET